MFLFCISNKSIKFDSFVTYTKQIIYFCGKFTHTKNSMDIMLTI